MSAYDFKSLVEHVGHNIECVIYGTTLEPRNVSIECTTCNVVLLSYDAPDTETKRAFKPFPKSATQGGKVR